MACRTIESKEEVRDYLRKINKILSIKQNSKKHFGFYSRDDDKDIKKTLLYLNYNFDDLKKVLKGLEIKDYLYTIDDEVNTYEKLPVFLVSIKNLIIYIKLGIKYEILYLYCFLFHEQIIDEFENRPYKEYKEIEAL